MNDAMSVRQKVVTFPADEPKRSSIGWAVSERIGEVLTNNWKLSHSSVQMPGMYTDEWHRFVITAYAYSQISYAYFCDLLETSAPPDLLEGRIARYWKEHEDEYKVLQRMPSRK